jgi:hypothetical protein
MFIGDISIVNGIITRMDSMFFFSVGILGASWILCGVAWALRHAEGCEMSDSLSPVSGFKKMLLHRLPGDAPKIAKLVNITPITMVYR